MLSESTKAHLQEGRQPLRPVKNNALRDMDSQKLVQGNLSAGHDTDPAKNNALRDVTQVLGL